MEITQTISAFPAAPNSATDTAQQFNVKANAFVAHQANIYTQEVNNWATQANAVRDDVNNIVSTIPDGHIDDITPSAINTYSSNKIESITNILSGANGDGSWSKFPDGLMICYGEIASQVSSTAIGGLFISPSGGSQAFPQDFIAIPSLTYSTIEGNAWATTNGGLTTTTTGNLRVISFSDTGTSKITWQAIGRWK